MRTWVLMFYASMLSFRLEFCFPMPVSGSSVATSEKVDKPIVKWEMHDRILLICLNTHFIL